jgi:hypothetical protein
MLKHGVSGYSTLLQLIPANKYAPVLVTLNISYLLQLAPAISLFAVTVSLSVRVCHVLVTLTDYEFLLLD